MSTDPHFRFSAADGLGKAVIAASPTPLLLLDEHLMVIAVSRSFEALFDLKTAEITGLRLDVIGSGEWGTAHLRLLLAAVLTGDAPLRRHEINLRPNGGPNRRLSLDAETLDPADAAGGRLLLLAITDLTDIRAREKRDKTSHDDKDVLLQELQHRIGNSLQIIASVLMQSARRTQSAVVRAGLEDAHHRVLAVAEVQSHLAAAHEGQVQLRGYLTTLCRSIAASMIDDPAQLSIEVDIDESTAGTDDAMNIGLIVTELVINALKHAFPDRQQGKIMLRYQATGSGWTLLVSDTGVGMHASSRPGTAGLGTTIVEALVRKLKAQILIVFGGPGTAISITR